MQVWNALHAARWKYRTQKWRKNRHAIWAHRTTLSDWVFATKACIDNRKKILWSSNISSTCLHSMANFGLLAAEICWRVWCTHQISTGFASWLRYCSDVAHRRPTKLCTMFGRLLGCSYTMYTLSTALAPWRNFAMCRIHFASKSCVLLYWQRYCTALQQRGQPNFAAW